MKEKEIVYVNNLFDCYNSLLTTKESLVFKDYYFNDLTLAEIADNNQVSRSAIQKTIKKAINKMEKYESQIGLLNLQIKLKKCLEIDEISKIKKELEKIISN